MVDGLRSSPFWGDLTLLAQSTVYDTRLIERVSTPTEAMTGVDPESTAALVAERLTDG